jgi:phosphate-selective porin OprO/OprP
MAEVRRRDRTAAAALLIAPLVAAALPAGPAAAQGNGAWPAPRLELGEGGWPPRLSLGDGAFTMAPTGLLQLDLGTTFDHSRPGGPGGGFNPRRARLGVEGEFLRDFEYALTWDFGGTPGSRGRLYQASVSYAGLDPFTLQAGVFEPNFSLQQSRTASNLLFLERATVVRAVADVAAGSRRTGVELRANGERWLAAAALTGPRTGPGEDSSQRGATARVAGVPLRTDDLTLHLGLSGAWSFRPPRDEEGRRAFAFSENAELSLDRRDPPLGTGSIAAASARTGGVELGLGWRRLQAQGEWYALAVDRPGPAGGGTRQFSGWYVQASWTLVGEPRRYRPGDATWGAPRPSGDGGFDPGAGRWGAVEIGARFSTIDLNDREVRGGRQRVWNFGVGWWPLERVGVFAQYQIVDIAGGESGNRSFQAVALRGSVRF